MRSAVHEGIVLNVVTIIEVAHYLRHLPREEFLEKLDILLDLETLTLINLDLDLTKMVLDQFINNAKLGIRGRDSVILATMKAVGTKRIASHDEVFKRVKGLEVIDPIPKA